ncbi:hypothetical protein [Oricola indica]|uniref:hypothetical protein n=1 Tax=Oricola indica TaxID=2872591 RepID=UPI003CCB772E
MKSPFAVATIFLLLISLPATSQAQSLSQERLRDWEFKFYACKHVVMNAAIVVRLMAKHQITDQDGITEMQSQLGSALAKSTTESEELFQFTKGEAWFISGLTFAVVSGMVSGGFELSDLQLIRTGSDICIHSIDSMAQ